jgi:WD40 repeat protein
MRMLRVTPLVLLFGLFVPWLARSEPAKDKAPVGPVSYYRDVRPVLQQHCQGCHQPAKPLGGYVMTTFAGLLRAGDGGKPGVVPKQADKSVLVERILLPKGHKEAMPKDKDPLPVADVAKIGRWISEGAIDDTPKTVQDVIDDKHPPVYRLPPTITSIDFSPDGNLLAVAGHHEVLLHKGDGSALVARLVGLSERIQAVRFSPDGKSLAVAGGSPARFGEIQIWKVGNKFRLEQSVPLTFDTLYGVSWSPDSTKVAFGCADNSIRAIDAATGKQILFQGAHSDLVLGTTFTQDNENVVSISRDMSMKLTEVKTMRFVDNVTSITPGALKGGLLAIERRPQAKRTIIKGVDGADKVYDEVMIGGADGIPRLYKIHRTVQRTIGDDNNRVRIYPGLSGRIFSIRFNKEGTRFAAGSSLDGKGEVRVFETDSGKVIGKQDATGPVFAIAYLPAGKVVAAAGFDGKVRLLDADTGKVVKEFIPVPLVTAPSKPGPKGPG